MRMSKRIPACIALALLAGAMAPVVAEGQLAAVQVRDKKVELSNDMRKLWEDHVFWTRLFIVSAIGNLPDFEPTTNRLLKNQNDIGDAMKPFYGNEAGDELTNLLRNHVVAAGDVVAAARDKKQDLLKAASDRWYANADSIATFLNQANPTHWKSDEMKSMMKDHLDMTLDETTQRLQGNHKVEIETYDRVRDQALKLADMLTDGILMQFPDRFAAK